MNVKEVIEVGVDNYPRDSQYYRDRSSLSYVLIFLFYK